MLKRHFVRRPVLLLVLLTSASCSSELARSSDASIPDDAGTDTRDGAAADGTTDADVDADVDEVDPTVLTNFSFEAAKHIELGDRGALQPLEGADQVDYYAFDAQAGEVYVITTNRGRFTPDNVISLYSPDQELLAENDTGWLWPNDQVDARLVVRAQQTGTYYVVIEDRVLPSEVFDLDIPSFYYRVTVEHVDRQSTGFGWDSQGAGDLAQVTFADDEATGVRYVTLIGELREGEVDRFELQGRLANVLIGHVLPGGADGNGSTLHTGLVAVRDASEHLVAQIDGADGVEGIHPPVDDASYTLSVEAAEAPGDNAFYAIDLVLLLDNPREADGDNDGPETATGLLLDGGFSRRGTVLAEVPEGDVDYFTFEAMPGDHLQVHCEGSSAGSGVRDLRAELRDADDEVLAEATETVAGGLQILGVTADAGGTYYLRLTSETPDDSEAPPAWARCAVIAEL